MRLTFHGAAGTVTGSRYRLSTGRSEVLIDSGMFQGLKRLRLLNWAQPTFSPRSVKSLLLTHAHLDHTGTLPRLVRLGFRGRVYATAATVELAGIVLRDAAKIQEEDAAYANRKGFSKHRPAKPLFTEEDAERALRQMRPVDFDEWVDVEKGVRARWSNMGHILGASMIEVRVRDGASEVSIVFSGDVGRYAQPLHVDPSPRPSSDYLVIESTYGNRTHPDVSIAEQLREPLRATFDRGGVVLIPAFAVGRSQLVTLVLRRLMRSGELPEVPIHIDSPMAVDATEIYSRHLDPENVDEDVFEDGRTVLFPDNVRLHRSVEESKWLNSQSGPRIIISSSGMLVGGRVLHHLRSRLPDPDNLVCLAGFQAEGTRGRDLLEGRKSLRMHGREIPVRARTISLDGLSGHADSEELLRWYRTSDHTPSGTFVTHGELRSAKALAERIAKEGHGWVHVPDLGDTVKLDPGRSER